MSRFASKAGPYRVGLIGADIGPSLSPALHEREAAQLGLDYAYELIDINLLGEIEERIGTLLRTASRLGFRGVNITHPCKQAVVQHLTELSVDAAELSAVNTVVFEDRGAIGHNTDRPGFEESFARGLPDVETGRVVLIGAGGAGSAVAHAALSVGVQRLQVFDAQRQPAVALVRALRERYGPDRAAVCLRLSEDLPRADGLIHATPTGMEAHPGMPFAPGLLHEEHWVAEVVYRPLETELLRRARRLGCRTLDGGGMAVFQAALSFELFTGITPDRERMLRHFVELAQGGRTETTRREVA
jgi:shikimate dehydrogenase